MEKQSRKKHEVNSHKKESWKPPVAAKAHTPTRPQKKLGWQNQCQTKEIAKPFSRLSLDCHDKGLNQVATETTPGTNHQLEE